MELTGWLIYDRDAAAENASYIDWFMTEANKQSIHLQLIYVDEMAVSIQDGKHLAYMEGKLVAFPDFIVMRTINPLLQHYFAASNVPTYNDARTAFICNHKSRTYMELSKLGIPLIDTFFTSKSHAPPRSPLPYPVVVKEATGRSGKQVYMAKDDSQWEDCLQKLQTDDFLIQAANVKLGKDVRVFIIGKEIIGAVLRKNEHDFRANFKLGGKAIPYTLTHTEKAMIMKIIHHFEFGLVGIDFLITESNELVFNEIEDVVGSRILSAVTQINLLEKYVTFIKQQILTSTSTLYEKQTK